MIARSKFSNNESYEGIEPTILGGTKVKHEFSYTLKKVGDYVHSDKILTGIPVKVEDIEAPSVEYTGSGDSIISVNADTFIPGSISVSQLKFQVLMCLWTLMLKKVLLMHRLN